MSLYKIYGIVAGVVSILIGSILMFNRRLDSALSDNETSATEVRRGRIIWGILIIIGGLLSLSAVLFGWPHVRGYIIPPP